MNQYSSITESSSDDVISSVSQSSDRLVEKRKEKLTKEQILSRYNIFDVARKIQHPQTGFEVSDRSSFGRVYRNCFVAKDAVQWLIQQLKLNDSQEAVVWGQRLQECGFIAPISPNKTFKDKTVLFRFSAVVPRQVFKSSIFLSRGTPTASGQNTPQASPRARSTRCTPLAALSTASWPNIPEYLFDKYNAYRTTKLLDKGYFFTSYSNTGTIVVGNMYNSEQLVYVYHKSPLVSAVVQFPRIITAHENNTLQVYDVTEPEEVVRYRIEDFVQRSRDKLEALVLDDTHLVLITQRQCFMFYLRDLTHEPHTTVDIELVSQFRESFSSLSYPYLLLGGSMAFKVYHVVSNTLVFEGKCIPPMLSFLEIKICGTTVVTNSSNSIAIWKIGESLSAQNPVVKTPQVLVSSLAVYEDYVIAGDIKGSLRLLQCADGSPVNVLGRSRSPNKYRKSATSNRPRSTTLVESVTDLKFDRKINAIHRQGDHVFAIHQDNKITVWDLTDIVENSKPKDRFALPHPAKEMSVTWQNDAQGGSIAIYSKGVEDRYKSHPNGVVSFAVLKV